MRDPDADNAAARQILVRRARQLANAPRLAAPEAKLDVLVCRVRQELYAIELRSSIAVLAARGITAVPCTPPHIAGVLNVRGELLTVLDLAAALGLSASPSLEPDRQAERARVVLVDAPHARVGLLVEDVLDIRQISLDRLARPLSDRAFVRGIADGHVVVLDLRSLLAREGLEVNEQPA